MRKTLQNCERTRRKLAKLPTIYAIGRWAGYGVRDFPFSGKFDKKNGCPLVYSYEDCNGTTDYYELLPIIWTTTGDILAYTFNRTKAYEISNKLNEANGEAWRNE